MSKLTTYRISYRVSSSYYIDIEAFSADEARGWVGMFLDGTKTPLIGSRAIASDSRICDVAISGFPLRLPVL